MEEFAGKGNSGWKKAGEGGGLILILRAKRGEYLRKRSRSREEIDNPISRLPLSPPTSSLRILRLPAFFHDFSLSSLSTFSSPSQRVDEFY